MQAAGSIDISIKPEPDARAAVVTVDGRPAGVGKQDPYKVGSWLNASPEALRASYRIRYVPSDQSDSFGFRCGL